MFSALSNLFSDFLRHIRGRISHPGRHSLRGGEELLRTGLSADIRCLPGSISGIGRRKDRLISLDPLQKFIEILAKRKGFALSETVQNESEISGGESRSQILNGNPQSARNLREFKESQYNLLADTLRKHLDMQKIYEIMGLKH